MTAPTQARSSSKPPKPLPMVCSRAVHGEAQYFPQRKYEGRTFYFCTGACLNAFLENPERFLAVHPKKHSQCEYPGKTSRRGET